jgi:hypothetical protein
VFPAFAGAMFSLSVPILAVVLLGVVAVLMDGLSHSRRAWLMGTVTGAPEYGLSRRNALRMFTLALTGELSENSESPLQSCPLNMILWYSFHSEIANDKRRGFDVGQLPSVGTQTLFLCARKVVL